MACDKYQNDLKFLNVAYSDVSKMSQVVNKVDNNMVSNYQELVQAEPQSFHLNKNGKQVIYEGQSIIS